MKKNIIFYSIIILLIIAKLYLISSLPINAEYTTILDDALFVKQANSIAEGRWLGDYDNTTLIKGVFMPLFIVVLYIFKIPYIIGQELFYSLACVLFITIIKDKVKSKPILIIIFTILLLNPVTYSTELCRIYRDGVYASLILYLIPTGMLTISILTVCSLNYKYYGVFELNQYWNTSFKSAYGALTRVTPEQRKERVPVTRETLKRIYEISPKFNELYDLKQIKQNVQERGEYLDKLMAN